MKLPDIQFQSYNNNRFDFIYASSSVNDRKVSLQFKHLFAFIKITLPVDILSVEGDNRLGFYVSSSENIAFQDLYNEGKVYFDMEKRKLLQNNCLKICDIIFLMVHWRVNKRLHVTLPSFHKRRMLN